MKIFSSADIRDANTNINLGHNPKYIIFYVRANDALKLSPNETLDKNLKS